ncbi:acetolactate synthase large subunit [Variovorax sp. GB1P17]|uniref:acetolactate synthase large subunit n=1 Tax=Variovorax sp. GB1P17 TaxID=3443740 RepID=UPI003F467AF0
MNQVDVAGCSGAAWMLEAARDAGSTVCFANPGTTEMPFVEAFDQVTGVRAVLGLFEGVCTGAADGYGRMLRTPAMTLLHLGPGFANGIANLHNARRARTPIVNLIGDHASWHLAFDAPLTSDIDSLARPVSVWLRTVAGPNAMATDVRAAIAAAQAGPGGVATLVVPVDFQQAACPPMESVAPASVPPLKQVPAERIDALVRALREGERCMFLIGGEALAERGQRAAARIAAATGAGLFSETFPARTERGGGLPDIDRLPYFPEAAVKVIEGRRVVLAGAIAPVAYFGYPGLPSMLAPPEQTQVLSEPGEDGAAALEALADALAAPAVAPLPARAHDMPQGALTPTAVGRVVANLLPDRAIVSVEGGTCGYPFVTASAQAARHTILTNTGGAIGQGLPVALGASIACPDRRVIALQSDGSAQYTIQALWTMAREQTPVTILITSNRRYAILQNELTRAGVSQYGPQALALTELERPAIDWLALATAYGVPAVQATTAESLAEHLAAALQAPGPRLIEMVL